MREWLPADHLVWFVLDAVAGLDVSVFRALRRLGGAGRAAYDPGMLLALLIYAYAVGQRSSLQQTRLCLTDVAFRIACAQDAPDHATIARFRAEHERALDGLFTQVLMVCARAGMGRVGTIALDGTKIAADAALSANRSESRLRRIAVEVLAEAAAVDAAEDEQFGPARGDELPPQLACPDGRAARIKAMLEDIAAERAAQGAGGPKVGRSSGPRPGSSRPATGWPVPGPRSPNATRSGPGRSRSSAPRAGGDCPAVWCRWMSITTSVPPPTGWPAPKRT
jgi:transposase